MPSTEDPAERRLRNWLVLVASYGRAVIAHWMLVVGGVLLAAVALIVGALATELPSWAFWIIALVCLVIAQYRAWRDVHRKLDAASRAKAATDARRRKLRTAVVLRGEELHPMELLADDGGSWVTSREFYDCTFKGPAMVTFSNTSLINISIGADGGDIETVLFKVEGERRVLGLIGFLFCKFDRCKFDGVGFFVDPELYDKLTNIAVET